MIPSSAPGRLRRVAPSAAATEPQRDRLFAAQRAGIASHLHELGMSLEAADRWLEAWEGSSNMEAERHSPDFWERGGRWASAAWEAGHKPPVIES